MRFDWDSKKAAANVRKHGVRFEEAMTIDKPQKPVVLEDWEHSDAEDRYYLIGFSNKGRLLTVCVAYDGGEVVRIISARKATQREAEVYAKEISKRQGE